MKSILSNRRNLVILNSILAFLAAALVIGIAELAQFSITMEYNTLDGIKTRNHMTLAPDVATYIEEHPKVLQEGDILLTDSDTPLTSGLVIRVKRGEASKAEVAGKKQQIYLYPGTVAETLKLNKIEYTKDDIIKPALKKLVTEKTSIVCKRVTYKTKEKTKTIEARDKITLDPSLSSGVIDTVAGHDGEAVYTYKTRYINGKKDKTTKKIKEWITKPQDNEVRLGTSETGESGEVGYSRIFTANATAYYAGKNAHGATGARCYYGTCAVDPSVIPYGTKLYVEGYGTAIANDCGGAVKGNIIDLYMHSTKECYSWGRRNVKTYVLE